MSAVFLTNGLLRKTLAAARSLHAKGIQVYVGEKTRWNPAAFSNACYQSLVYPDPQQEPDQFYEWLLAAWADYKWDVLFPMDDDTMEVIMKHRQVLERFGRIPLPKAESWLLAADKAATAKLAKDVGVAAPVSYFPKDAQEVARLAPQLHYPMVIKPRKSSGSRGIRVVQHSQELTREYAALQADFSSPFLQEFIPPGERSDVCLLYGPHHRLLAAFAQKELRHFPLPRGPSTAQESVKAPHLLEQSVALLAGLAWYGVVEVEYMRDPRNGKWMLMEINPRFWNSLHLAVRSGVDFPSLLYQLAMGEEVGECFDYEIGKRCRSLLPGDVLHYLTNEKRGRMDPPFWAGRRSGVEDDILSLADPLPTVGVLLACLRYSFSPEAWKMMLRR
jgi:predicted ATP-grasp superfamily ATP-dependent carboligase